MTQQDKILIMLREAGDKGISSFGDARKIALQLPRVMNDLRKAGYNWTTRDYPDGHVDYILVSEPKKPKQKEYIFAGNDAIPLKEVNKQIKFL